VFSGLAVLSLVISQIHKLMTFWDNKTQYLNKRSKEAPAPEIVEEEEKEPAGPVLCPSNIQAMATLYRPLVESLAAPFQLIDLYNLAQDREFPHPHLTLTCFRQANFLIPQGDGYFTWNELQENQIDKD
jgi:hypothetical protein